MANLIDKTFFVRDITLPNLETTTQGGQANIERLNSFITKYEPKCLMDILGYPLFKLFMADNTTPGRIKDIKVGAEYYDENGLLQKWQGLIHDTDMSLIANFVYFYIQTSMSSQTSGVNTNVPKGQAGLVISPREKMIDGWNYFSSETFKMCSFLWNKRTGGNSGDRVYPEFTWAQYHETRRISRTLNFMSL